MVQYRKGTYISTGAAVTLPLGFVPDKITVKSITALTSAASPSGLTQTEWVEGMPAASTNNLTYTAGVGALTYAATNGFTPVVLGGDWQNTQYVITNFVKATGVVTVQSVSPTNTLTLVNGMTVTISGVVGTPQLNQNRYIVGNLTGTSFTLYDLYGNKVDASGFGTYVSGGILNQISYPPTAPVLNAATGQVITPGQPAGNQYDIGFMGIILGTSAVGTTGHTMFWEAITETPTGW